MSENSGSSSATADDFIYIAMEEKAHLSNSLVESFSSSKSPYSQVVFHDLSEVYPTDGDISFTYSFQTGVIPQEGDRIALYKVGWSSVSEFFTSLFTDLPLESGLNSTKTCKITFPVANLPKDEVNMYQFCYITSGNIVAGSSIPFTFRKPQGSELVAIEDPNEPGLVVFRSRVTQLQEQVFKCAAEREALERVINELKSELYLVKKEANEKVQKCVLHKESIHDMTQIIYDLNTEKKQLLEKLEESTNLEQQAEELKSQKEALETEIASLQAQIDKLQHDVQTKDEMIASLNEKLRNVDLIEKQLEELSEHKTFVESETVNLKFLIEAHEKDLAAKNSTITILTNEKKENEDTVEGLKKQLTEARESYNKLEQVMKLLEKQMQEETNLLKKKLEEQKNDHEKLVEGLKKQNDQLMEKLEECTKLGSQVEELKGKSDELKQLEELKGQQKNWEREKIHLIWLIEGYEKDLTTKNSTITVLTKQKNDHEELVEGLKKQLNDAGDNFDQLQHAMKLMEKEMQEKTNMLNKKLKEVTEKNNASGVESLTLSDDLRTANNKIKSLEGLVKTKDGILRELLGADSSNSEIPRRLLVLEDDNSLLQAQINSLEEKMQSCESENSKLSEANHELKREKKMMADQLSKMNEELRNRKQCSFPYCKGQSQGGPVPPPRTSNGNETRGQSPFTQFSQFIPFFTSFPGESGAHINVTTSTGEKSKEPITCEKCRDLEKKLQTMMMEKADIRSDLIQTKHSNEEYCRHLRDVNEEAAALRSRIAVLEIELRKAKEVSITIQGEQKFKHAYDALSSSLKSESPSEPNPELTAEINKLKDSLNKELETKALLQRNVEALMKMESNYFVTKNKLQKEIEEYKQELTALKEGGNAVDEVRKALDDMDLSNAEVAKNLQIVTAEKAKLEKQLIDLMKESIGKISLSALHELRDENEELKRQLNNKECCKKLREKLGAVGEAAGLSIGRITQQTGNTNMEGWSLASAAPLDNLPITGCFTCPVCMMNFPPNSADAYKKHFSDHID